MIEFFALLLMVVAAILGGAFAISYFWRTGPAKALGYAAFFVVMIFIFGASGLWIGASRHSWGVLTPLFALMLAAGWLCLKYAPRLWEFWKRLQDDRREK